MAVKTSRRRWPGPLALPALREHHPIALTSFDDAVQKPAALFQPVHLKAQQHLDDLVSGLDRAKDVGRFVSAIRTRNAVKLVFSDKAKKRLKDGTWALPVDKKTRLPRT